MGKKVTPSKGAELPKEEKTPQGAEETYSFPELGVSVQARSLEEAIIKAKKEKK